MDKKAQDWLEDVIFVQLKVVTDVTIARHFNKSTAEAHVILKDFFNLHNDVIRAVYTISGNLVRYGTECGGVVLAKTDNLEEIKATFKKVDNVELFALHKDPIDQLATILAHDTIEDEKFFRDDDKRAGIKAVSIRQLREKMETSHKEEVERQKAVVSGGYSRPAAATTTSVKSEMKQESISKPAGQKNKLTSMFQKACEREKTPKNSPKKVPESPFSSTEKKTSEESPGMKKRARRIIIDSEDEISPAKKSKTPEKEVKKKVEKPSKREKKTIKIDDEDLYEAESPEKSPPPKEPSPEKVEKKKVQKKTKTNKIEPEEENEDIPIRRSPRKLAGPVVPGKKKIWVDETYKDVDGFLVTKKVLKEVEIDEKEEEQKPLSPKKTNQAPAPKTAKKTAPASQSKISAFFTKK